MDTIIKLITELDSYLSSHPVFIFTLLGTGLFFTIYLGFPQIRHFGRAWRVLYRTSDNIQVEGDASHFQALATALSGTVGTGNIAGVALAIHIGGPAALFWMIVTALIGMATKFVEVTLSHKYRIKLPDGTMAGGPMFYMAQRLNININGRLIKTGQWLAVLFSVCTIIGSFGTGCLPQVNSISTAMYGTFGMPQMAVGGVLALVLALVILGGIKRIVKVTEKLVPIMGVVYVIGALIVIMFHIDNVLPGLYSVFSDIFTGSSATGGFLGASAAYALSKGVNRGLFSNEAGQGSAPIAHAAARCKEPIVEGFVALLEPFIDTVVICSLTGIMIISSGVWKEKFETRFQKADIVVLDTQYNDSDTDLIKSALDDPNKRFSGELVIVNGRVSNNLTIVHSRSIAEDICANSNGVPYTGILTVNDGVLQLINDKNEEVVMTGKSLVHSAPLTVKAFASSWLGDYGEYIVAFSLLLFAFSTTIAWSYYGDRASVFLFGPHAVVPFRILYVAGFFIGSFTDTSVVWSIASIGIVMMAMPNLLGILILHKEIKSELTEYESKNN